MSARDLMNKEVRTCSLNDTLESAARIMEEENIGSLPVLDENQRAISIITDRDIALYAARANRALSEIKLNDAIDGKSLKAAKADDDTDTILAMMSEYQIRRVPVLEDGGAVLGMISLKDLLAEAERDGGLSESKAVHTLVEIARADGL